MLYKNGDVVRFDVSFDYQGPAYTFAKLRCVVGVAGTTFGFDEKAWTNAGITLPETLTWTRFIKRVLVTLKNLEMGETYDTYTKLMSGTGQADIFWNGVGNIQMATSAPDSEFRDLEVQVG
ncbi:hypothetical protein LCGC14_0607340 [marine sediment metagenome]|uniref:Uncharacterized protein n=1 Tax=marine sediment metagenome TaxID=412755 RepID=A0A0F9UH64_9ZZZZ